LDLSRAHPIVDLLKAEGSIIEPQRSVAEFVSAISEVCRRWQLDDSSSQDQDRQVALNTSTIVDQVWFRGHSDCNPSLQPGLYRKATLAGVMKDSGQVDGSDWGNQLSELMELENELRIDFMSYGHLLNQPGKAISEVDWYFLMQHHRLPTRLLDWTTNALAALFFALYGYAQSLQLKAEPGYPILPGLTGYAGVWMIDAYWLANEISASWTAPMLPNSKDATRYIPSIQSWIEDSEAAMPPDPMPIEPTSIHPRVAAQEAKFIIFGSKRELLDQQLVLHPTEMKEKMDLRVLLIPFDTTKLDEHLEDLARLGISRRTLFPDFDGLSDFLKWKRFHHVSAV
jgi:hypothetical protein